MEDISTSMLPIARELELGRESGRDKLKKAAHICRLYNADDLGSAALGARNVPRRYGSLEVEERIQDQYHVPRGFIPCSAK